MAVKLMDDDAAVDNDVSSLLLPSVSSLISIAKLLSLSSVFDISLSINTTLVYISTMNVIDGCEVDSYVIVDLQS